MRSTLAAADTQRERRAARAGALAQQRVAEKNGNSTVYRVLSSTLAWLSVAIFVALALYYAVSTDVVSFYRIALLGPHCVFAGVSISVSVSVGGSELRAALLAGISALLADLVLVVVEASRLVRCSDAALVPATQIDFYICSNESGVQLVLPVVAGVLLLFLIAGLVVLFSWIGAVPTRRRATNAAADTSCRIGAWLLIVLFGLTGVGVAVAQAALLNGAAFYRAAFLLVPLHVCGLLVGAVFNTSRGELWLGTAIAAVSTLLTSYGAFVELRRLVECTSASLVPSTQVDAQICTDEFAQGFVLPVLLTLYAVLSLVAFFILVQWARVPRAMRAKRPAPRAAVSAPRTRRSAPVTPAAVAARMLPTPAVKKRS